MQQVENSTGAGEFVVQVQVEHSAKCLRVETLEEAQEFGFAMNDGIIHSIFRFMDLMVTTCMRCGSTSKRIDEDFTGFIRVSVPTPRCVY
jgi:hypothetical protein